MTATGRVRIHVAGVKEALRAFDELPRKVRFKHLRIALNAGAGLIRDRAASLARRETGLLAGSLGIKVKIPDASYNEKHHGKPAYAVIGPKRKSGHMMLLTDKKGQVERMERHSLAQADLIAERKRLAKERGVPRLAREIAAIKSVLGKHGKRMVYRNPSRYAHLVERRYPFMSVAARQMATAAIEKMERKLADGIQKESRALASAGG